MNKFSLFFFCFFLDCFASIEIYKLLYNNSLIPPSINLRKRILTTISCEDCNLLPKVENAGKTIIDGLNAYQIMHNGIKTIKDCYYGKWMTIIIELLHGHHEPQEEKAFYTVLPYIPENAVMIEVGSYWGYYSMWFQQQIPYAKNYLIEPDPKNLMIGKKNFEINNMEAYFTQAMIGAYSENNKIFIDWDYNQHLVDQISIDDYANNNNIEFIYLLHSDIQGAELEMLHGCKKLIEEKRIGYFFISTHRGKHEECLKILKDVKLDILLSITREESFSADGLIVAKLPEIPGPSHLEVSRRSLKFCDLIEEIISNE